MKTSSEIKNISAALVKVIGEVKNSPKTSQGYGYKYSSLDEVLNIVRPIIAKHGLTMIQSQSLDKERGLVIVKTLLMHISGEFIETQTSCPFETLKGMNAYQSLGSAITYLRRYAITSMFAIASEEDTDANPQPQQRKPLSQKQATPQPQPQQQAKTQNSQSLKDLGIEIVVKNGIEIAKDLEAGACYKNKNILKQMGFHFNGSLKSWIREINNKAS